ncbi:MAG: sulfatase-like hydrolase/transferase, partial [Gemmatimonadota bacterium]
PAGARYFGVVLSATKVIVMILFPWALFTLLGSIWFALRYEPTITFADLAPAGPVSEPAPIAQRVVLVLFDELDQELAIDERPADVQLPEFDRFRQQALVAIQFYPNGGYTQLAIPGILSGRKVVETRPAGTDQLVIRYEGDQEERDWIAQPNLFEAARELGFETAVSGWYHPYCRLFNESLTRCFWMPIWWTSRGHDRGILQSARDQWQYLLPGLGINRQRLVSLTEIKSHAELMAVDEDIDLLFVHYPIPHRPIIYDRKRQQLTTFRTTRADYFDNLVLADHTLGALRAVMEENGVWDDATVVVTADHGVWDENYGLPPAPLNRNDIGIRRVPLLMKLPRQRTRVVVSDSLHASVLHDLLLGLLQGQIVEPNEAREWLKAVAH